VQTLKILTALRAAMSELPPADHLIVKLRYEDQFTVARIAKLVDAEQKQLYRRFDQLWKQLRASMKAKGVSDEDVRTLFGDGFDDDFESGSGNSGGGPSHLPNAGGKYA
jgi:hypothetical protein